MSQHKPEYDHAMYLNHLIRTERLKITVRQATKVLRRFDFDAIAFRGLSGTLVGPTLALRLNKTMLAVRKPNDGSHSFNQVEGDKAAKRYVIIDDFISTGNTVRIIRNEIRKFAPAAVCIGVLSVSNLFKAHYHPYPADTTYTVVDPASVELIQIVEEAE